MTATSSLVRKVLEGKNPQLQRLAAEGLLPVPPDQLIPLQVKLARSQDPDLSRRAETSLQELAPAMVADFLAHEADDQSLTYFALEADHALILEAIVRRRDVAANLLVAIAPNLSEELQEVLLLRQDAIVEEPRVLEALERNPRLSKFSKRRIQEYREHLLAPEKPEEEEEPETLEPATPEEAEEAIAQVKEEVPPVGEPEEVTGLTETQIRELSAAVRLHLAHSANRTMRQILIKDPNPEIALACIQFSAFTDGEVEAICRNRSSHEEVLEFVLRHRQWMSRYAVVVALVRNPKAPLGKAVKLVPRLSVRDLRSLRFDRNVPDAVRQTAMRLYRIKVK